MSDELIFILFATNVITSGGLAFFISKNVARSNSLLRMYAEMFNFTHFNLLNRVQKLEKYVPALEEGEVVLDKETQKEFFKED